MEQRTLRARLRDETREIHAALEHALDLLNPQLTLAGYRQLLERFYGYYAPLETAIAATVAGDKALVAIMAGRSKCSAIAHDLTFLGADPQALGGLPTATEAPTFAAAPEVAGALYVVEGSTLGGAVLSRCFSQRWGLTRERGLAFFDCYGEQTGQMWQRYLEWLPMFDNAGDSDRVVRSAIATFRSLAAWLTGDRAKFDSLALRAVVTG